MNTSTSRPARIHEGRNLKRFREMLGVKQEMLACELGEEWSQKRVSLIEAKETIEARLLTKIAKVLGVPEAAIRNFDEEAAILNIQKSYDHSGNSYPDYSFNPIDKLIETLQALTSLHMENKNLYERLLESEREKNALLRSGGPDVTGLSG